MTGVSLSGQEDIRYRPEDSYSENAEFWVKIIRDDLDPYRTALTDAAVLDAIGNCAGLRVLDAGCGEGYFSRKLAARGAEVSGVDITEALILPARKAAADAGLKIDHRVADLATIPYGDAEFDVVVCNHIVTDIAELTGPFAEISRALKSGGRLVILMLHPCFYSAHAEREELRSYAHPAEYFSTRSVDQEFVVSGIVSPAKVKIWLRPLEYYMSLILANGFVLVGLSEPHPAPEVMASDLWWRKNFVTAEKR
jgi:2-polyprenyl-3-methyl-5-hydroxy-6-metoxy-1,4-benzoquinol methylase